jgi:hypothetical protein
LNAQHEPGQTAGADDRQEPVPARPEEPRALVDEQRRLTAQLLVLTAQLRALDHQPLDASHNPKTYLLAILQEQVRVLRQARALDADVRRLFVGQARS